MAAELSVGYSVVHVLNDIYSVVTKLKGFPVEWTLKIHQQWPLSFDLVGSGQIKLMIMASSDHALHQIDCQQLKRMALTHKVPLMKKEFLMRSSMQRGNKSLLCATSSPWIARYFCPRAIEIEKGAKNFEDMEVAFSCSQVFSVIASGLSGKTGCNQGPCCPKTVWAFIFLIS
ncbi:uncharacterized protein LOC111286652 isoform X2 [Durio zibethinus]|uniref:Uncharacterized protein LOC111286652 isoform X2 n=1 Tax=Durio zibethinus TaxID=66656 RepID=A0A6P5XWB0_DURZI|nr:uncharacterized protein LOC111286652 isoform X2 [Durio zibethinus]